MQPSEGADSIMATKEILSFTLTEKVQIFIITSLLSIFKLHLIFPS